MAPTTHGLIGWIIAQPKSNRRDRLIVTAAAIVPDVDGLSLLFGQDAYLSYHHTFGHSLLMAVAFSLCTLLYSVDRTRTFLFSLLSFHSHLLADLFGSGHEWPIPYLWPLSMMELSLPAWISWELRSWQNLAVTVACFYVTYLIAIRKDRTFFEFFSAGLDSKVVATIKKRTKRSG